MKIFSKQHLILQAIGVSLVSMVFTMPALGQLQAKPIALMLTLPSNPTPVLPVKEERLKLDSSKPGDGDDSAFGHPDFAWRQSWVEAPQWGGRIAYVDTSGTLRVKMRDPDNSPWVVVAHNVSDFQVMDWRIAVLKTTGALLFAEGPLNTPLKLIAKNVQAFQMSLTRIGVLQRDGTFLLREHGFEPRHIANGVKMFQVLPDRLALLTQNSKLWAHHGGHVSMLKQISENVQRFQLEREWIGIVQNNRLQIAKGDVDKLKFIEHGSDVADFEMEVTVDLGQAPRSRMHLAIVNGSGQVLVGESDQTTVPLQSLPVFNARTVRWAGRQLAIHTADGNLVVGRLRDYEPTFEGLTSAGATRDFRINQEGELLLSRGLGQLSLIKSTHKLPGSAVALDMQTRSSIDASDVSPVRRLDLATEALVPGAAISIDRFSISSMRPEHTRRAR